VNVGVAVAGYVIDLRERSDRSPLPRLTIDGAAGVVVDEAKPIQNAGAAVDGKPEQPPWFLLHLVRWLHSRARFAARLPRDFALVRAGLCLVPAGPRRLWGGETRLDYVQTRPGYAHATTWAFITPRCCENGIGDSWEDRRRARFANTTRCFSALYDMHLHQRCFVDAQHSIIIEIALLYSVG
jgi:hypothetical protein